MATVLSDLRRHPQLTAFILGLLLAVGGAVLWSLERIDPIKGSLLVGIGASVIAAALVAYLSPSSEEFYERFLALGIANIFASRKYVPSNQWVECLKKANRRCVLLGIAHANWCSDADFKPTLIELLNKKRVPVKMFFLNPSDKAQAIRVRGPEDTGRTTRHAISDSIKFMWNQVRPEVHEEARARLELYVYDATPSCGLTWVDDTMMVTHYLAGIANPNSPVLILERGKFGGKEKDLYEVYEMNMDEIAKRNTTVRLTDENITEFLQ